MQRNGAFVLGMPLLIAAAVMAGSETAGSQASPSDKPHPGRNDYVEWGCYQCHGYQGQGGVGPRLAPDPLAFDAFAKIVRRPYGVMPAYAPKVLSDKKLKRIHAYLQALPPPPDVSSVPLLSGGGRR